MLTIKKQLKYVPHSHSNNKAHLDNESSFTHELNWL